MTTAEARIIGLDYVTESGRGVLIDAVTGTQLAACAEPYRHGLMTRSLPDGRPLPRGWALQDAADYTEVAEIIRTTLGRGRTIVGIGLDFTASSSMPATREGQPLSALHPDA